MSSALDPNSVSADTRPVDDRKQSPPAFLDLADSAARLGTNMPDISARVELKRMEHERQRAIQRKMFEEQMHALEQQQAQELLSLPVDGNANSSLQHLAVSAPTTPPRVSSALGGDMSPHGLAMDPNLLSTAVGRVDKRKSVTYAPITNLGEYEALHTQNEIAATLGSQSAYGRTAGAKSMPASRRTSASSHDDDLATHLQGLSVNDPGRNSPHSIMAPQTLGRSKAARLLDGEVAKYVGNGNGYNAGILLDEQIDKDVHNAMRQIHISDEEKFSPQKNEGYPNKFSASSAALDLAHLSQSSSFVQRALNNLEKSSEWPQFTGATRGADGVTSRNDRRTVATPQLSLPPGMNDLVGRLSGATSASATPHIQQHTPGASRRSSPLGISTNVRNDLSLLVKTPGTPQSSTDGHSLSSRLNQGHQLGEANLNGGDLSSSLSRISPSQYDSPVSFGNNSQNLEDSLQSLDNGRFNAYGFEANNRVNGPTGVTAGSTALYGQGSRYGMGMNRLNGSEKINGLHGAKHKRGDIDREFNRFAGTRLEDLQGEIASLCKDQHGCRYLQKKLEEGVAEHRDMIFRETFSHFAELMTDPFGNYLCQKLLEYATDEQRNLICESVAQDLVNISLNMHGTRAVQKMIDFLSTQRQTDLRYNAQIHSIIVALSLHVVVLIKDLNGNHVIQKCLNKLTPEDNQFIYNAVAANCVEVATHRHGCCVLQRCIDHASDQQRVQLVNEITYNALTLVQDPYGNYVVQYILDLNDNRFSDAVIRQFTGNVCALSVQKFSSNVIEKCIRVAEPNTRRMLIEELLHRTRLEKLLRDSFGNYCVQTALDYAESNQRALLVEGIRPILPLIRNTPYGKRIQSKLQREQMELANANGINHYNGHYNQQQALMNMALAGQSIGGQAPLQISQGRMLPQSIHPGNQINDMYNNRSSMYGLGQGSSSMHGHGQQALHLHNQQLAAHTLTAQGIDGYVLQNGAAAAHAHVMAAAATAPAATSFGNVGGFTSGVPAVASFGGSVGLAGGMNDHYSRSYGYGM